MSSLYENSVVSASELATCQLTQRNLPSRACGAWLGLKEREAQGITKKCFCSVCYVRNN